MGIESIAQRFNLGPDRVAKLGGIEKYATDLSKRIGSGMRQVSNDTRPINRKKVKKKDQPSGPKIGAKEALVGSYDKKGAM